MQRLFVDDVIDVHGWVMMRNLTEGRYRVVAVDEGMRSYTLQRTRGHRTLSYYWSDIHCWLREEPTEDLNYIERVKRS